jgi:hypothetical protein
MVLPTSRAHLPHSVCQPGHQSSLEIVSQTPLAFSLALSPVMFMTKITITIISWSSLTVKLLLTYNSH